MQTPHTVCVDLIIGTRPNIVKAAPLLTVLRQERWCQPRLIFLMQHTDATLAAQPMEDLGIADEMIRIPLKQTGYGSRLGEMLEAYSQQLADARPDLVVVFGDVDTTLAAAYAAKRANIPLAHVEAGLRSGDKGMPEELNRLMVDSIADLHFTTTEESTNTLIRKEGHSSEHVHFVGNLMIDALLQTSDPAHGLSLCREFGLESGGFALATFHRPSNVDGADKLREVLNMLKKVSLRLPVLLPLHPRTSATLRAHHLMPLLEAIPGIRSMPPIRYRDFVSLLPHARVTLTDSGGIQEEASALGVHCITVRDNTERPVTLALGSNRLATPETAIDTLDEFLAHPEPCPARIPGWDGKAASRIAAILERHIRTVAA